MRSYKAARRAGTDADGGQLEPIPFEVTYEKSPGNWVTDKFSATGEVSATTVTDLAYFADVGVNTPEGAAILRKVFMEGIGDEQEFTRFWRAAAKLDEDTLVEMMSDLIADTTGRPTKRPSPSPQPSLTTGTDSRVTVLPGGFLLQRDDDQGPELAASSL